MQQKKIYTAIGMMSGTSMDGLDVAMIRTDGEDFVETVDMFLIPYEAGFQDLLKMAVRTQDKEKIYALENVLTQMHATGIENLLLKTGMKRDDVDVIGMHGQTVLHEPDKGRTWQIGNGDLLAEMTGIPVVYDFRSADVGAGGEGAPLAPIYHRALAASLEKPVVFLNIGGVSNITWMNEKGDMLACDTGPGNALLDDWVKQKTGEACDVDGKLAEAGSVDQTALTQLLSHPFFAEAPPKSLDRDAFDPSCIQNLSVEDGAATLSAFTVEAIAKIADLLPETPRQWLVCGGGRHNHTLMKELAARLEVPVNSVDDENIHGDILEAEAFAYMAVRHLEDLPISFPGTTGVTEPMTGGVLSLPSKQERATL